MVSTRAIFFLSMSMKYITKDGVLRVYERNGKEEKKRAIENGGGYVNLETISKDDRITILRAYLANNRSARKAIIQLREMNNTPFLRVSKWKIRSLMMDYSYNESKYFDCSLIDGFMVRIF